MAYLWNHGQPVEAIIPICLVAGALCGAFNGLLVTRFGLPSLAVTIGTLALFRGLAFVIIGDDSVTDFPPTWTDRAFGNFAGTFVPDTIVLFAVLAAGFARAPARHLVRALDLRHRSQRGDRVLLGPARQAHQADPVHAVGAPSRRWRAWSSRCATRPGAANVGQGFELTAVTAVLLGGVSIFGGRGTIAGVILALFLLGGIQKALLLSESISSYWIQIVTGRSAHRLGPGSEPRTPRREGRRRRSRPQQEEAS